MRIVYLLQDRILQEATGCSAVSMAVSQFLSRAISNEMCSKSKFESLHVSLSKHNVTSRVTQSPMCFELLGRALSGRQAGQSHGTKSRGGEMRI